MSLEEAARSVRGAWLDSLRYNFYEVHLLSLANGEAVLRFITQIGPSAFFVTGDVRIHAANG